MYTEQGAVASYLKENRHSTDMDTMVMDADHGNTCVRKIS